ncbi:MAG TPA: patatin-like phospholipase family protein [Candidatus Angelobacter sp.]|nr:patatin-like phospholipase family protein [Candidatus Angelobacter sp.]
MEKGNAISAWAPRIAIAMSGGGFRASLFHLGVLKRLAELGWLKRVDALSTVSGGSIIGAFFVVNWQRWVEQGADGPAFDRVILNPFVQQLRTRNFLLDWMKTAYQWPIRKLYDREFTRTTAAAELLDKWFFNGLTCAQLPERPFLVLNSTSLQSIRAWRFTRHGLGDSRIGYGEWTDGNSLPLSTAVCASASFPPVFPPMRIRKDRYSFSAPVYGETNAPHFEFAALTDGGVYDNSGMEALIKPTDLPGSQRLLPAEFLIVSDGGAPATYGFTSRGIPALTQGLLLYRADAIAREQVTALRTRMFMDQLLSKKRQGMLVSLRSATNRISSNDFKAYCEAVPGHHHIPGDLLPHIRAIRTSLDRFSEVEANALMYHGYLMTDCFLWCYRGTFSSEYTVPEKPEPSWKFSFSDEMTGSWSKELPGSRRTARIR